MERIEPTARAAASASPARPRRWRGRLLIGAGAGLVLLVAVAGLAPRIAGWVAPGYLASTLGGTINGTVSVDRVSLAWFGRQRIGPVTVRDDAGHEVATVGVELSRGLIALLRGITGMGPMDLGELRVAGRATIVREADGRLNLDRLPKSGAVSLPAPTPPPGAPREVRVPPSLAAKLVLDNLEVLFHDRTPASDPAAQAVRLENIKGEAVLATGAPITFNLTADATAAGEATSPAIPAGTLSIRATVDGLIDSVGIVTPEQAKFDATIEATELATAPTDALAHLNGALVKGLGDRLTLTVNASGTSRDATAELRAVARGLDADLMFRYGRGPDGGTITAPRSGSIRLQTAGLAALVPGLKEAVGGRGPTTVTTWPEISFVLEQTSLRVPTAGWKDLDLRGSSLAATIKTGEMRGTAVIPGPDGATKPPKQPFRLGPMTFTLRAPDLAGTIGLTGHGAATIGAQPAGALVVGLSASGLLDANGKPVAGPPRTIAVAARLTGVSTMLAQPLVEAAGLDLARDVGPVVDLDLRASAKAVDGRTASIPSTTIDLSVRSANLQTSAALMLDASGLHGRDAPEKPAVEVSLASAGTIAARLADKSGKVRIAGGGAMNLGVARLDIPMIEGTWSPALDRASAQARVSADGFRVLPILGAPSSGATAPDAPVQLETLNLAVVLAPGKAPHLTLDSALAYAGGAFALKADMTLESLIQPGAPGRLTPASVRPVGTLSLADAPTTLARLIPQLAAHPGQPPLDVAKLIQDAVGERVTVNVDTSIAQSHADRLNARMSLDSPGLTGTVAGGLVPGRIAVDKAEFRSTITPRLASSLLGAFAPALDPRPTLARPATLVLAVDPIWIPVASGSRSHDLASAGDLTVRITLDRSLIVQGLALKNADGSGRDLGSAGLEGLQVTLSAPFAALLPWTAAARVGTVTFRSRVLSGPQNERLADMDLAASIELSGGTPAGSLSTRVKLTDVRTAGVDEVLQQPGLVSGAIGPTLSLDATADVEFPARSRAPAQRGGGFERASLTASVASARLSTDKPLKATLTPDRLALDAPLVAQWRFEPGFANRRLLAPEAPEAGGPLPPIRFTKPADFTLVLSKLRLAMGEAPMKPGGFALDFAIEAPALDLVTADGTPARFGAFKLRAASGQQPGALGFSAKMSAAASDGSAPGKAPVDVSGGLSQLCDEQGRLTIDRAVLTAQATAKEFPTAIVDALARQQGLLLEALGPAINIDAGTSGAPLSKAGDRGTLDATVSSPRADAKVKGVVRNGAFAAQGPVTIALHEITPALGGRLVSGLPMVGGFEKRREDGPATLTATGLTLPVDGDLGKLNGEFALALGEVRFQTSRTFAGILRELGQRDPGSLRRRVPPFRASIKRGVLTYDRYRLRLGEFDVDIEGRVDFADRRLDVVTYIPLGALTDEAAGLFKTGLGRLLSNLPVLDSATLLPWRTKGSFDNPTTEPDLELFLKQIGSQLNPPNLLPIPRREGGG